MTTKTEATLDLVAAYRTMQLVRRFEERCLALRRSGKILGSLHPCCGQEAIPAGAVPALDLTTDRVIATYRGHGWALGCGTDAESLFAELLGRQSGVNGGRGGSAYFCDPEHGFLGENSIVGAGVPISCGVGLAANLTGNGGVALVSFGDGATSQGSVHEAMVMAAQRSLPVVLICENNKWSEMTPIDAVARVPQLAERAAGYGIPGETVDGNDPAAVNAAVRRAVERARKGDGPTFLECMTHRLLGHYNADVEHYRPEADREQARAADPIPRLRSMLVGSKASTEESLDAIDDEVVQTLQAAEAVALAAPVASDLGDAPVTAPVDRRLPGSWPTDKAELTMGQALNEALRRELAERPETLLFGEDVAIPGGVFGITKDLHDEFGAERVFDTPIAESAILGSALGAALSGYRPIVEVMWTDFLLVALDQLVNQAANLRFVSGGALQAPLVVRCQQGVTPGSCAQHSQSLEAFLAHVPGLLVGMPSTAQDAYGMLRAAVASPDPVILIESRALYGQKTPVDVDAADEATWGSRLRREGDDLTIVSWGKTVGVALKAAELLDARGVRTDVLDLRWLNPLDDESIRRSVAKTSRLLVAHEANITGGFGAEISARVTAHSFDELDAPVLRVAPPDVRWPASPSLQEPLLPSAERIAEAALGVVSA